MHSVSVSSTDMVYISTKFSSNFESFRIGFIFQLNHLGGDGLSPLAGVLDELSFILNILSESNAFPLSVGNRRSDG